MQCKRALAAERSQPPNSQPCPCHKAAGPGLMYVSESLRHDSCTSQLLPQVGGCSDMFLWRQVAGVGAWWL